MRHLLSTHAVEITHWNSFRLGSFRAQFSICFQDGNSFWIGAVLNGRKPEWGRVRMDFNPSKVAEVDVATLSNRGLGGTGQNYLKSLFAVGFQGVLILECVEKGLVNGRLAVTDSTHIKANASKALEQEVDMQEEAGNYWERLDAYEEEGQEELKRQTGKRQAKRTKQIKKDQRRSHKKASGTDPESGYACLPPERRPNHVAGRQNYPPLLQIEPGGYAGWGEREHPKSRVTM